MPTTGHCANCGIESTTLTTRGRYPGWCATCRQYMTPSKTRRITPDKSPAVRANRQALEAWLKQHQHITTKLKSKSNTRNTPPERLEARLERLTSQEQ